jgi:hypothetical protein
LEQIQRTQFPAFLEAEERGNYAGQQAAAEQILATLKKGGRATMLKNLEALATDRDRTIQRLHRMVESDEFEKIAKGEFPFDGSYYPSAVHRGLVGMRSMIREDFAVLRRARDLAKRMQTAVEQARVGSGQPIPTPDAIDVKAAMSLEPNPILEDDARLFAVFALDPELLVAALKSENPGGKANSFRLTWNRDMAGSGLTEAIREFPPQIANLRDVASHFGAYAEAVEAYPGGSKAAAQIYGAACDAIVTGMSKEGREQFDQHRKQYESGAVITALLQAEVKLLRSGETQLPRLADAFQLKFP